MYTTSSLEDIAKHFEQNAAVARRVAAQAKVATTRRLHVVEASTWQQAADFIRNVRIVPMETHNNGE